MLVDTIKRINKENKHKKGIFFYQMHKGCNLSYNYVFIEKPTPKK